MRATMFMFPFFHSLLCFLFIFSPVRLIGERLTHVANRESLAKDNIESIAELLFRYKIMKCDQIDKTVFIDEDSWNENLLILDLIWEQLKISHLQSPLVAKVQYVDAYKTTILRVIVHAHEDERINAYSHVKSMRDYVETALPEITHVVKTNYQPESLTFAEIQRTEFTRRKTLASEDVRLCGLTEEIETFIMSHLVTLLYNNGFEPRSILYFGSRVMPRTEVLVRDPAMQLFLPIIADGVTKNVVRMAGLTEISDLEIMVIASSRFEHVKVNSKMVGKDFKKIFSKIFREFPISPKILIVDEDESLDEPFDLIDRRYREEGKKILSKHQFVSAVL